MMWQRIFFISLYVLILFSCVDDKSNYNYLQTDDIEFKHPMNQVKMMVKEPLQIKPVFVHLSGAPVNKDDFTYEWKISGNVVGTDSILELPSTDFGVGSYRAMFSVISKATKIHYTLSFTLEVDTKYSNGWVVLYDDGSQSELAYVKGREVLNEEWKYVWVYTSEDSVYSKMNGELLPRGCKKLVDHGYKPRTGGVNFGGMTVLHGGPDGGVELDGATMMKDYTVRELFLEEELPAGLKIKDLVYSSSGIYVLGEDGKVYSGRYVDKVFWASRLSHLTTQYKGAELNIDRFIPTEFQRGSYVWLMYSKERKSFLSVFDDEDDISDPNLGRPNDPEYWKSGTFLENTYFGDPLTGNKKNFVMLDNMTMDVVASGYMNSGSGAHQAGYLLLLKDPETGKIHLQRHEDVLDRYVPATVIEPRYNLSTFLTVEEDDIFLINAVSDQDVLLARNGVIYAFKPDFDEVKGLELVAMDYTYSGKKITSMEFNNDASRLGVGFSDGTVIIYAKPNIGDMKKEDYKPKEYFHQRYKGAIVDIVFKNGAEVQGYGYKNEK